MAISVLKEGDRWIVRSHYDDRHVVKAAGCRWNPDRKLWWTDKPEVVEKLGSPDVVAQINAERQAAHERTVASIEASRAASADIAVPAPAGLSYLPYQLAGVAYAQGRDATLIADEMGLGKTIQALGLINSDKSVANVLIVCPASLKLNWQREARKWLTRSPRVCIVNGAFPGAGGVVIINYEQVKKFRREIDAVVWDVLVVDEAHYLKNAKADRTQIVLGKWNQDPSKRIEPIKAKRRVFLTGTPILNRPAELWTLVHALDRKGLGANWRRFHERYCNARQGRFGWDVSGASNLDELQAKLRASVMVRRMKADVLRELPPKRRQVIAFPAESAEAKAAVAHEAKTVKDTEERLTKLRARADETKMWADPGAYRRAVEELNQAQFAAFAETSAIRHEVALAKAPDVIEHVTACLDEEDKLVVMVHHHDVCDQIVAALGGYGVVKADGRDTLPARDAAVTRFQTDPTCRVMVMAIGIAVGWTLTAAAHVVFAELDWVPGNLAQAEDRCHRIGQHDSVLVQHLVLDGSLDARMAQLIVEKMDVITAAVDDKSADDVAAPAPIAPPKPVTPVAPSPDDLTPDQVEAVHEALKRLAGVCDGAFAEDGHGFNKLDTAFGHKLAREQRLSQKQAKRGAILANKYRRQLPPELLATIKRDAR